MMTRFNIEIGNKQAAFEIEFDVAHSVSDYLRKVASAIVTVLKRIFCLETERLPQDILWDAERCRYIEMENFRMRTTIEDLKMRNVELQDLNTHTFTEVACVEGFLLLVLFPYYIMCLPMLLIRDSMYNKKIYRM